jgi:hypothetical protein
VAVNGHAARRTVDAVRPSSADESIVDERALPRPAAASAT